MKRLLSSHKYTQQGVKLLSCATIEKAVSTEHSTLIFVQDSDPSKFAALAGKYAEFACGPAARPAAGVRAAHQDELHIKTGMHDARQHQRHTVLAEGAYVELVLAVGNKERHLVLVLL